MFKMRVGADYLGDEECRFLVWAPLLEDVAVKQVSPYKRRFSMEKGKWGYWRVVVDQIPPGTQYFYELEGGKKRPDPASNFQPRGVHGPYEVVDHDRFQWRDSNWGGIPMEEMIIYELHVGTFTPPGTFEAVTTRLDDLQELGVNAIEVMPVGQFPGNRNWGYDGVQIFAPQNTYGGPREMKKLIDNFGPVTPESMIPITLKSEQFLIVLAGGDGKHSHYFPPFLGCFPVSKIVTK
jgi:maltooligosyltrehalose trehalohydrolase